ncbi:hypothetical protein EGJ27_23110 [Pseudomonas sp. v388]|uniref:DUF6861 domain-containing protein n=1 Tax=Pseudomonas sp. v388 TaxID=2479849 RepID=UPI000F7B0F69|nr:polymorphic toxin type 15 domain-containing protein [Pseudomonas sp. v388]RRV04167.1 hypothetical protein EGJ27_23110 [Pseudomonas sp. v388]
MLFARLVPSWHEMEARITREMGYQNGAHFRTYRNEPAPSLSLNLRRLASVRSAFIRAEWDAGRMLRQRFADLDIASVLDDLIEVVTQMAMIVAGSALAGGMIGAGVGALFGGAGVVPMSAAGFAMGAQVSTWLLGMLGLTAIAEFFVEGLPRIGEYYLRGISIAWEGPKGEQGLDPFSRDDPNAESSAAFQIALGHVEVVVLLLSAIIAYLTRGRGNAGALAQEMRTSPKGARLGEWMLKHEESLKQRPDLQRPERIKNPFAPPEPPANRPAGKDNEPAKSKPNTMPLHEVECFKADKLPTSKIGEFERQLGGQEGGLNQLTVEEFLENVVSPVKRDSAVAKRARRDLQLKLQDRFLEEFMQTMDELDAEDAAIKKAKETMSTLAGLHNPDLKAGGKDVIADFGDRQVNSSIGPQWKSKLKNLKRAAESVSSLTRKTTFLNVRLRKC